MIKVVIAEDHLSFIEGIMLYFEFNDEIKIVDSAENGQDLLNILSKKQVDVIVTDIRMPLVDGIEATEIIRQKFPKIKVIAFTTFDEPKAVFKMFQVGAMGYLLKNSSLEFLKKAILTVYGGDTFYDPNLSFENISDTHKKEKGILTKRQKQILELIRQRKTNNEIAEILHIHKDTVATHRKNMIKKLNLSGANALLTYALNMRHDYK
ncbi:response regulator transcription factor [uncultured Kordia sp.]|uniref:response regulator n=1 Tax=uncultured Kordia sp. TaxID=507699 RepID=UPI002631EF2A|nr:response regulator transcription factor [uncultured Kordia sp.]